VSAAEPDRQRVLGIGSNGTALTAELVPYFKAVWADPGVKATYLHRAKFQMPVEAEYFFERLDRISDPNFIPTKEDILHCRVRTTGIMETTLQYQNFMMKLVDVGGQRNERRKWIHSFQGVHAVLFVAAISEYDQSLFEDEKVNRMNEALTIFNDICNSEYFKESSMMLFLNKSDLFEAKLKRVPITVCFPEYTGDNDLEDCWKYIAQQFLDKRKDPDKQVYVHLTCATDDSNVTFVFNSVRDIVIQKALKESGLIG